MIAIILNFSTADTIIKTVPKKLETLDGDAIIEEMGYKLKDVSYMICESIADIVFATDSFSGVLTIK